MGGFDHLDIPRKDGEKEDHYVARVYIAANREIEKNPGITEEIDRLMQKVERGDAETVAKFRRAVSLCAKGGIKATLAALNAHHDRFVWESDFVRIGDVDRIVEQVRRLPQAHEDETLWVDLTAQGSRRSTSSGGATAPRSTAPGTSPTTPGKGATTTG